LKKAGRFLPETPEGPNCATIRDFWRLRQNEGLSLVFPSEITAADHFSEAREPVAANFTANFTMG
jgi:hypothetical protein